MLTEQDITSEIEPYARFHAAYREGKRGDDLPQLPRDEDAGSDGKTYFVGIVLHPVLVVLSELARLVGVHSLVGILARARITTDRFSDEPCACGLNAAYTNLGLTLLAKTDVPGAIQCLDASWRVHPCPHNTTFGLRKRLALALKPFPEANKAVEEYVRMGKKFAMWPQWWASGLE